MPLAPLPSTMACPSVVSKGIRRPVAKRTEAIGRRNGKAQPHAEDDFEQMGVDVEAKAFSRQGGEPGPSTRLLNRLEVAFGSFAMQGWRHQVGQLRFIHGG